MTPKPDPAVCKVCGTAWPVIILADLCCGDPDRPARIAARLAAQQRRED